MQHQPRWVGCLLIFNPLWFKEFADSMHTDIWAIACLAAALKLTQQTTSPKKTASKKPASKKTFMLKLTLLCTLSVLLKGIAVLILPVWPNLSRIERLYLIGAVGTLSLGTAWLWLGGFDGLSWAMQTQTWFQTHWVFNPLVFDHLYHYGTSIQRLGHEQALAQARWLNSTLLATSLALFAIYLCRFQRVSASQAAAFLGITLCLRQVVNPWYLFHLWPLLAMIPVRTSQLEAANDRDFWRVGIWWCVPFFAAASYSFYGQGLNFSLHKSLAWALWLLVGLTGLIHLWTLEKTRPTCST